MHTCTSTLTALMPWIVKKIIKERQKEQADNTLQKKQKNNLEELQKKEIDNLKKRLMYAIAESENIKKSLKKESK